MVNKFSAIIIFYCCIFLTPVVHADDPCSFLNTVKAELKTKKGILATIENISKKIHGLIEADYFQNLDRKELGIYFTRQPGFYFTLDCGAEDSSRPIAKIGMFGVGDTFKPLRKKNFSNQIYYYGLTRSGLMSFVRKEDLRKMKRNKVYFFNRTITATNFCTNTSQCSGAQKEFNARYHYATMELSDFDDIASLDNCVQLNVEIFNGGKPITIHGKVEPEYENAQLKYCDSSHDNGIYSNDTMKADRAMSNLAITGQYLILSSKALKEKIPFLFTKKECLTKKVIKKNTVFSLGGSIGAEFSFMAVKADIDVGVKETRTHSEEKIFDPNKQYLYQNYTTTLHNNTRNGTVEELINDIVVTQTCGESSVPTTLNEIRININPKGSKLIALDIKELDKVARNLFPGVWITASSTSRLKGHTWLIASVEQNMQWKDFVFSRIYRDIQDVVPSSADKDVILDHTYYYRSLFMATAFEFVPKAQVEDIVIRATF